jgi:hypothetical protein
MSAVPEPRKNASKTRGKPFQPGNSGKPKGAKHKTTLAVEALLEGQAGALTQVCIQRALDGDPVAMRIVMDRICPLRRGRPVQFDLPSQLETAADLSRALAAVLSATANGALTPEEAGAISQIVDARRRSIETVELEQRIAALEGSAQ